MAARALGLVRGVKRLRRTAPGCPVFYQSRTAGRIHAPATGIFHAHRARDYTSGAHENRCSRPPANFLPPPVHPAGVRLHRFRCLCGLHSARTAMDSRAGFALGGPAPHLLHRCRGRPVHTACCALRRVVAGRHRMARQQRPRCRAHSAAMRDAGIKRIDHVLITHFHDDHVGGVPELVKRVKVGEFLDHGENREDSDDHAPRLCGLSEGHRGASAPHRASRRHHRHRRAERRGAHCRRRAHCRGSRHQASAQFLLCQRAAVARRPHGEFALCGDSRHLRQVQISRSRRPHRPKGSGACLSE